MKMWQRGLVVTMALAGLGGVVTPGAVVFADEAVSATSSSTAPIQSDTDLTLAGDAIAVQKLKVGKTMAAGTTLVKIYYMKPGTVLQLSGPYTDFGGYTVTSNELPKINTDKYVYVVNDEGLSQDGTTLNHKDPETKMSKDEPKFSNYSKKWSKKLSTKEVKAINEYSKNYGDMNNWLRSLDKKASSKTKNEIKLIDSSFKKFKNPKTTTVWRGLSTDGFDAGLKGKLKVGATYTDKGYMSATFDQEIAKKYATGIVLQIALPKGKSTGAYIGNLSDWKIEKEYLIKHGSQFKVTAVDDLGDNKLVSLKYVK
ncbi:ADP-ribosyltransferase [Weissella confusa]|uniref:ADP-ribosyltransferase n=1 Tax=Weissella confusa TaxID=1583 RepID=UPI00223C3484|nr:ADP-ribosyltransferase [Weissella confusa]MCT0025807.1 ADP-ribosylating toxin [Weissella confusa]